MRRLSVFIATMLAIILCGPACAESPITHREQLNQAGMRVGVSTGSASVLIAEKELPNAEIVYFEDSATAYEAVAQGKIDAYVYDRRQMELAIESGRTGVRLLDENMDEGVHIAVGISPVTKIPDFASQLNAFIAEMKANGTLDDMFQRWVLRHDETMPQIDVPQDAQISLAVGTSGVAPPYSYYVGTELNGYDIELANRFAAWLGASLTFKVYDYGAIIPAAITGDVDCIMANLNVTPERAEALYFSDELYAEQIGILVRGVAQASAGVRWQDYNGKRLGVLVGPLMEDAAKAYFPDSEYLLFNTYPDCVTALLTGKIDAYLGDEPGLKSVHAEQPEIDYIHDRITQNNYSFAFRKDDPESAALCQELNDFLARSRADGTMQELDDIWFGVDETRKVVDMSGLTGERGTIRVVTTSTDMPFSYIKDGNNVGYDIDLVVRFCRDRGYALELGDVDFAGRISAIQSGKYDFTTDMNVTPEREEQVLFSDPTSYGGIVLAVKSEDLEAAPAGKSDTASATVETTSKTPQYQSFSDLSGKRVSMLNGAPFEELVRGRVPDVGEFSYYSTMTDLLLALRSEKTDAILMNNAVSQLAVNRNPDFTLFPQSLQDGVFGLAFAKGDPQRDAWQAAFDAIPQEAIQAAWEKWTGADESVKTMPQQDWPGSNGTVKVAACDTLEPMSYAGEGGELKGFDLEVVLMMARELDVHVEFVGMELSAVLSCVQSGKALLGAGSIIATDERRESVDFIDYQPAAFVLVVRAEAEAEAKPGLLDGIKASFHKTFIREDRWQLFVKGVLTTLEITLLSILFGTLMGFMVFMLCRNGNPVANRITRFCVWLVQGMPMVVLLMVLYYIIFGSVAINGIAVAVVGFTLTFGAAVFGLLKIGVGAVDGGQYEAAYALGYSNRSTFFRVILPQALPHVMPAYKGEIVGLIKATAIVGYIAVQDLTKMGDIVRSRTYEAFFPLIAVTIIYFVLEGLIGFAVSRIGVNLDPKRRKPVDILKGVKTDDQN